MENKKPASNNRKKKKSSREYMVITYLFLFAFMAMIFYEIYYIVFQSEEFIASPYNNRVDLYAKDILRGDIKTEDGVVIARSELTENGTQERIYPFGNQYAHIVGYAENGKAGIEKEYNFQLLRSNTFFIDQIKKQLRNEKTKGDTLITTLQSKLQKSVYDAIGNYKGAVIVSEPATGKILAMVSKPDFDPNTIVDKWDQYLALDDKDSVLINRATQGLYPPGSTFKILTTLEYLREHPDPSDFEYKCSGSITKEGSKIRCYNSTRHGKENLEDAFKNSCNCAYADLGVNLDIQKFEELCNSFGFNNHTIGNNPFYDMSNSKFTLKESDETSLKMETAMGQGNTMVSPYQLSIITNTIANGGIFKDMYVLDHVENEDQVAVETGEKRNTTKIIDQEKANTIKEYMREVVVSGTGKALQSRNYKAYGKTGSAEFGTDEKQVHSWFTGFVEVKNKPVISVTIIAEGAGTGSTVAVPIAKKIFDSYAKE